MDFLKLVNERTSTRVYSSQPVEGWKIDKILECCRLAPSACNSQPWSFVVVDDHELKSGVAAATCGPLLTFNRFANRAPVIVAVVMEPAKFIARVGGMAKNKNFALIDIGIVAEHFCLAATELGLGTCMIGWFDEKKVGQLLHVPKTRRIPLLITLGYADSPKPRTKIRKTPREIKSVNKYGCS